MARRIDSIVLSRYILAKCGPMSHLKLQKILYYINSWHLVFNGDVLIDDDFQAWVHGPVSRRVWDRLKATSVLYKNVTIKEEFKDKYIEAVESALDSEQMQILNDVLEEYSGKSAYHLECLTHSEPPWIKARAGRSMEEPCDAVISQADVKEYYSSLL